MPKQRKQTTFRIDAKLLKRFQHALLDRDIKMTPMIEALIRNWMSENIKDMEESRLGVPVTDQAPLEVVSAEKLKFESLKPPAGTPIPPIPKLESTASRATGGVPTELQPDHAPHSLGSIGVNVPNELVVKAPAVQPTDETVVAAGKSKRDPTLAVRSDKAEKSKPGGIVASVRISNSDSTPNSQGITPPRQASARLPSTYPTATANPWLRILGTLEKKITRHLYDTWLKPTRFSHANGSIIFVRVPAPEFRHIGEKFGDLIQDAMEVLALEYQDVKFVTAEEDPSMPPVRADGGFGPVSVPAPHSPAPLPMQQQNDWDSAAQLSPKYTFEAFVIGNGNQFAHAAAQAVAERPSKAYNPLFLYGGVGMGKTHLMQAIGHEVKRRQPQASICYISSEKFTNELINSLRYDRMTSFRDKFRNVDVLLIDDIQFLAHKERMQEEFFHTFNALHESMKQIVIASDRPPKELAEVEDRLRSRFEWGLIADIQPPDLETKVAILHKKAESERVTLSTDLALYIASNLRTNVRELEGALIRLMAYCSLTGAEINLATAQQVLKNYIDSQSRKVTIDAIQKVVAEQFGLRQAEIKARSNSHAIVFPRQIAMYLSKQMTEASLPEIGRQFGGKHSSTVLHSIDKVEDQRQKDKDLNRLLNKLTETLNN